MLCELTGAEAATVVNNNAAAVLLVLGALIAGGIGVAQYVDQQQMQRADDIVAGAQGTYTEAQVAYESGDYSRAEQMGAKASTDASSALALNPDNENAKALQTDAAILVASIKATLREQAETETEAREKERRLSELRDALASANQKLDLAPASATARTWRHSTNPIAQPARHSRP